MRKFNRQGERREVRIPFARLSGVLVSLLVQVLAGVIVRQLAGGKV